MVELDGGIIMKKEKRRDRLYDVLSVFLGLASLILGFLIYANNDTNGVYISKVLHTDVSFVEMNKKINSFFDSFLKFNNDKETKTVLGEITYFELENNGWCCVRPSGTEPKIKFYVGVKSDSLENSEKEMSELLEELNKIVKE